MFLYPVITSLCVLLITKEFAASQHIAIAIATMEKRKSSFESSGLASMFCYVCNNTHTYTHICVICICNLYSLLLTLLSDGIGPGGFGSAPVCAESPAIPQSASLVFANPLSAAAPD